MISRAGFNLPYRSRPFKAMISVIVLVAFLFNTVSYDFAWADRTPSELTSVGSDRAVSPGVFKELNVKTFSLPQSLGTVKDAWFPSDASRNIIIHIQDAHCNYYAQHAIANILEYLTQEYGASAINLEGGAKDYDLSIFTGIKDKAVRERVADYFVKEGLVNGAEYFALNNPDKVSLWGIEDTKLYIDNLRVYRDSLKYKDDADKLLKNLSSVLTSLKMKIYSKELLALDLKYNQYKAGNIEFKDYLGYLAASCKDKLIDIKQFPDIFLLNQTIKMESDIDFQKANNERDDLIDKLQKRLSKNGLKELVTKTVEFKAETISQEEFYRYLVKTAKISDISVENFPELEKYIIYVSTYAAIDKSKIIDEITALENKIRGVLYQNDKQRALDKLSKNLAILKNIFNISLTRADYQYYKANENSFDMAGYISFVDSCRGGFNLPYDAGVAKLDDGITRLDGYREQIEKFYECSFRRDEAFLKNVKFAQNAERTTHNERELSIVITGGFHTENLCDQFRKNNIAYVSIMPNFKSEEGYQCPYFSLLSGNRDSPVERKITTILASVMAVASPFTALNNAVKEAVGEPYNINEFRLEVEWAAARAENMQGIVVKHGDRVLGAIGERDEPLITADSWNNMSEAEQGAFKVAYATQFIPSLQLSAPEKLIAPKLAPAPFTTTHANLISTGKYLAKLIIIGLILVIINHMIELYILHSADKLFVVVDHGSDSLYEQAVAYYNSWQALFLKDVNISRRSPVPYNYPYLFPLIHFASSGHILSAASGVAVCIGLGVLINYIALHSKRHYSYITYYFIWVIEKAYRVMLFGNILNTVDMFKWHGVLDYLSLWINFFSPGDIMMVFVVPLIIGAGLGWLPVVLQTAVPSLTDKHHLGKIVRRIEVIDYFRSREAYTHKQGLEVNDVVQFFQGRITKETAKKTILDLLVKAGLMDVRQGRYYLCEWFKDIDFKQFREYFRELTLAHGLDPEKLKRKVEIFSRSLPAQAAAKPAQEGKAKIEAFVYDNAPIEFGTDKDQWQYVAEAMPGTPASPTRTDIIRQNGTNVIARRIRDAAMAKRLNLDANAIGKFAIEMGGISDEDLAKTMSESSSDIEKLTSEASRLEREIEISGRTLDKIEREGKTYIDRLEKLQGLDNAIKGPTIEKKLAMLADIKEKQKTKHKTLTTERDSVVANIIRLRCGEGVRAGLTEHLIKVVPHLEVGDKDVMACVRLFKVVDVTEYTEQQYLELFQKFHKIYMGASKGVNKTTSASNTRFLMKNRLLKDIGKSDPMYENLTKLIDLFTSPEVFGNTWSSSHFMKLLSYLLTSYAESTKSVREAYAVLPIEVPQQITQKEKQLQADYSTLVAEHKELLSRKNALEEEWSSLLSISVERELDAKQSNRLEALGNQITQLSKQINNLDERISGLEPREFKLAKLYNERQRLTMVSDQILEELGWLLAIEIQKALSPEVIDEKSVELQKRQEEIGKQITELDEKIKSLEPVDVRLAKLRDTLQYLTKEAEAIQSWFTVRMNEERRGISVINEDAWGKHEADLSRVTVAINQTEIEISKLEALAVSTTVNQTPPANAEAMPKETHINPEILKLRKDYQELNEKTEALLKEIATFHGSNLTRNKLNEQLETMYDEMNRISSQIEELGGTFEGTTGQVTTGQAKPGANLPPVGGVTSQEKFDAEIMNAGDDVQVLVQLALGEVWQGMPDRLKEVRDLSTLANNKEARREFDEKVITELKKWLDTPDLNAARRTLINEALKFITVAEELTIKPIILSERDLAALESEGPFGYGVYYGAQPYYPNRFNEMYEKVLGEGTIIEMGETRKLSGDDIKYFSVSLLGPHLVIIIRNKKTGVTYVAHSDGVDAQNILAAIDAAAGEAKAMGGIEDAEVIVAGACVNSEMAKGESARGKLENVRALLAGRESIIKRLVEGGFRNVTQLFPGQADIGIDLIFDRSSGVFQAAYLMTRPVEGGKLGLTINEYINNLVTLSQKTPAAEEKETSAAEAAVAAKEIELIAVALRSMHHDAPVLNARDLINTMRWGLMGVNAAAAGQFERLGIDLAERIAIISEQSRANDLHSSVALAALDEIIKIRDEIKDQPLRDAIKKRVSQLRGKDKESADILRQEYDKLLQILDNVIDFAEGKIKSTNITPAGLKAIVDKILTALNKGRKEKARVNVNFDLREEAVMDVNDIFLTTSVFNLLKNAVAFAKDEPVEFTVGIVAKGDKKYVQVTMEDHGDGIRPDKMKIDPKTGWPRVFSLNESERDGGTGLGLALVRLFIGQTQGASVEWDTRYIGDEKHKADHGTKFTLMMPVMPAVPSFKLANESRVLRFLDRDIVVVELSTGERQAFYKSTGESSEMPGKWLPFDGITPEPAQEGKQGQDRSAAWFSKGRFGPADTKDPLHRYGSEELKAIGEQLGKMDMPVGEETVLVREVNEFIGTKEALGYNDEYDLMDRTRGGRPIDKAVAMQIEKREAAKPTREYDSIAELQAELNALVARAKTGERDAEMGRNIAKIQSEIRRRSIREIKVTHNAAVIDISLNPLVNKVEALRDRRTQAVNNVERFKDEIIKLNPDLAAGSSGNGINISALREETKIPGPRGSKAILLVHAIEELKKASKEYDEANAELILRAQHGTVTAPSTPNPTDEILQAVTELIDHGVNPNMKNILDRLRWSKAEIATTVEVFDEHDNKPHSVYVITIEGNTYILEVGDRGTFTTTISTLATAPAVSAEIVRHDSGALLAQVAAANAAQGDVQGSVADWIILPGNPQFISTYYSKMFANRRQMSRIFDKGSDINIRDYLYQGDYSEDTFRNNMENTITKIAAEMRDSKYADKKPRAIIYAPAKEYRIGPDGKAVTGYDIVLELLKKLAPDLVNNFVVIREAIPEDGVVHEAIHVDLGRELLNYKRQTEADKERFTLDEKKRLVEHIRTVTKPETIPNESEDAILTGLLNGTIRLEVIKPADWNKWDKEQKAYIALRQAA